MRLALLALAVVVGSALWVWTATQAMQTAREQRDEARAALEQQRIVTEVQRAHRLRLEAINSDMQEVLEAINDLEGGDDRPSDFLLRGAGELWR